MADKCEIPNCPYEGVKVGVEGVKTDVASVKSDVASVKSDVDSIKKNQDRFENKQDQLIDAISNHKAILAEIKFIQENQEKQEDRMTRFEMNNRDNNILIFQKINNLEKTKAEASEVKEGKGWMWAGLVAVVAFVINKLWDVIFAVKH